MTEPEIIIVGAGAAGIGVAVALIDFSVRGVAVLDRHGIGASFERWPREMRLITPSFNSTPFGILDLNSVVANTSVANFLGVEHPTGREYARYLKALALSAGVDVLPPCEVVSVTAKPGGRFAVKTATHTFQPRFVIWAAGEFQFPKMAGFPGSELCQHSSLIASYAALEGAERIVIGAFESGADAAIQLARLGKVAVLLNREKELPIADQDPSRSLSPFTRGRLSLIRATSDSIQIHHQCHVTRVTLEGGNYVVETQRQATFRSNYPPILATGFAGGIGPVEHLFDYRDDGQILLTATDESSLTPGLFLAGPLVRHDHHIFCYIYKFRQRFAIIAETLASRTGIPVSPDIISYYENSQMRLADLSCCGQECIC